MADYTPEELAYAAGVMDGEGYIGITVLEKDRRRKFSSPSFQVVVSVGMTDPEICLWLAETFGGNVHSYEPRSSGRRGVHHWRLTSRRAAAFCELISPFLRIKRKQAELVVMYVSDARLNHDRHGGKGVRLPEDEVAIRREYKRNIQALNQRRASGE